MSVVGKWLLFAIGLVAFTTAGLAEELYVLPTNQVMRNLVTISDDGSTVVGTVLDGGDRAAYWTEAEGVVLIGTGYAHNCSADGAIIVGDMTGEGFTDVWGGPVTSLAPPVSDLDFVGAYDISPDGSVIVGNYGYSLGADEIVCAFRWDTNGFEDLVCVTNGAWCNATGVDATGNIICGFNEAIGFRWTDSGGYEELPALGGQVMPWYISLDGQQMVGSFGEYGGGIFRWRSAWGTAVLVADTPSGYGYNVCLSADGAVASGLGPLGPAQALIWDMNDTVRSVRDILVLEHGLPLDHWNWLTILGISASRMEVVGFGIDPDGHARTWVAHLDHPLGSTRLRITTNPSVRVSWVGTTGETYTVESRSPLASWSPFATIPGQEGIMSAPDGSSDDCKLYRLIKSPVSWTQGFPSPG